MKPNSSRSSTAVFVALGLLRAYKLLISPLFPGSCRFVPSCSDYAREAISTHGVVRGSWLAVVRVSRCHPFGGSGFDPVPAAAGGGLTRTHRSERAGHSTDS